MRLAELPERYRLKHGRWPALLEALVTDGLLPQVPIDPCDGQPLRWDHSMDGVAVHSARFGSFRLSAARRMVPATK